MIYSKRGSVVRWENGALVRVKESGVAHERGELFECHPDLERRALSPSDVDASRLVEVVRAVRELAREVTIERLIVIEGTAEHEYGDHQWSDHTQRIHLSLIRARKRALLDLASFDLRDVEKVAAALARTDGVEREAPRRLRLAPNVTAALLPSLVAIAPPNVRLVQTAGGVDGYGAPVIESAGPWPNAYRPSYRVRPVRMPLRLRIECDVTDIERDRPTAIALTAPISMMDAQLLARVLIDDGQRVFPSTVRIARIDAVSAPAALYPYGGGSFGAEMML
ncbi:MAG TPA: hypothetical protein VEK79_14555 [Thermoanaerobaculia bacterium]|nr:hypothetical protein [Thermoanaerobaculia bacterium]